MSFCRNCGAEADLAAAACLKCGVPPTVGKLFCTNCGSGTDQNAVICVGCGHSLSKPKKDILGVDGVKFGESSGEPNPDPTSLGTAILWFLLCYPLGYGSWGQSGKGWVLLLITILTGGFGGIFIAVDYFMCYAAQKNRKLGEWEFVPTK